MAGISSGNRTSMTAPITWTTVPVFIASTPLHVSGGSVASRSCERLRAADDFEDLLGDRRLTGAVQRQREAAHHLLGAVAGVAHRCHAGALLAGARLEKRTVHGDV